MRSGLSLQAGIDCARLEEPHGPIRGVVRGGILFFVPPKAQGSSLDAQILRRASPSTMNPLERTYLARQGALAGHSPLDTGGMFQPF